MLKGIIKAIKSPFKLVLNFFEDKPLIKCSEKKLNQLINKE